MNAPQPLAGRTIVVTRPRGQADGLAAMIAARGGTAIVFPLLEIHPADDPRPLDAAIDRLDSFSLALFVSPNAVEHSVPTILARRAWPTGLAVAAIGKGTVTALARHGIVSVIAPPERFDSEGLLERPELQSDQVAGRRAVIFRGDGGRELLADELRRRGAEVEYVTCYRRSGPAGDIAPLVDRWRRGELDAITVSSSEGLRHLHELLDAEGRGLLASTPLFVPHARIAETARALELSRVILTGQADAGLVDGLCAYNWPSTTDNMPTPVSAPTPAPDTSAAPAATPRPEAPQPPKTRPAAGRSTWANPWAIVSLVALGLAGWQWVETRIRLTETQQELAKRLAEGDTIGKESRALAKQSQESVAALQARIGALDAQVTEFRSQQATLETLFQELARGRDELTLAEVEQTVTLASQQLQLAGNVPGAVAALATADARLARSERPQFIGLRKVINRDLTRLRALPFVDVAGMSLRIENVVAGADSLPLAFDVRPKPEPAATPKKPGEPGFWTALGADLWGEFTSLVRIQRFERPEPALLAPQHVFFLRENLKLRLLNARLALLARDQTTFRAEVRQAQIWLERYFDSRDRGVQSALAALKQLSAAELNIELPSLNESLTAVHSVKVGREKDGK